MQLAVRVRIVKTEKPDNGTSVRISKELNEQIKEQVSGTVISATKFATMCIEDGLEAVKTGKAMLPRAAKMLRALKEK